jgi:CoA:oxalate CoA-transferase
VICCGNDRLFGELCAAIGRPDLAADARFASNVDRVQNNAALEAALESVLETRPAAYWLQVIGDAGVPAGPVLDVAQAAELPQLAARNMIIEAGGVRMPGNPIKISGYPDPKVRPGAPELDQHGAALRGEFAAPPSPSREPGETGKEATR